MEMVGSGAKIFMATVISSHLVWRLISSPIDGIGASGSLCHWVKGFSMAKL